MKKVLYIIDTLEVGGAETSILEICTRLENWKPFIVSIYQGDSLKKQFEEAGIKVFSLGIKSKFGVFEGSFQLKTLIRQIKPDIIHATLFKSELLSRLVAPGLNIPLINSFVNDSYSPERYKFLGLKQKFVLDSYRLIDMATAYRVTNFMSITHAIIPNNSKALKINPDKIKVIYRGRNIDTLRNKVNSAKVELLKYEYGEGPIILTVSRLLLRKGYIEAIEAIRRVAENEKKVKYLIAGEGHDRAKLDDLIKEYKLENNVHLLGKRNDIASLLFFCDLFLFPSHYEGQGGALIEAMIMGKPIIASRIPVIEESVKDNYSALLFQPQNVEDLKHKINWAISHPRNMEIYGEKAKADAEKRFDIKIVAKKHEKFYDEVMKEKL